VSIAAPTSPGNLSIARTRLLFSRLTSSTVVGPQAGVSLPRHARGLRSALRVPWAWKWRRRQDQAHREAPHDLAAAGVLHLLHLSRSVCCGEVQIVLPTNTNHRKRPGFRPRQPILRPLLDD